MRQATTKINLAVEKVPQFPCCNLSPSESRHQLVGTIHIGAERYVRVYHHLVISISFKSEEVVEIDILIFYAQITANYTGQNTKLIFELKELCSWTARVSKISY